MLLKLNFCVFYLFFSSKCGLVTDITVPTAIEAVERADAFLVALFK